MKKLTYPILLTNFCSANIYGTKRSILIHAALYRNINKFSTVINCYKQLKFAINNLNIFYKVQKF